MAELKTRGRRPEPKCLDVPSWRLPTKQELQDFIKKRARAKKSALGVRRHLSPVDLYCYLKGRFGEPNGFANSLRRNHSDNLIHWEVTLKADKEDVNIYGMSREIHIAVSAKMTDENWRDLILRVKADYERVAKEKSAVFKSLERWVLFGNRFSEIAEVCAELHANIVENVGGFGGFRVPPATKTGLRRYYATIRKLSKRASIIQRSCIELSLLTPVLAEAFINMLILVLCEADIRNNQRQFDAFIRSQIDTKLFDLRYKCRGFVRPIDQNSESFKNFKRVMDKRNHAIHGNCDPEREQIEVVYFEGTRPLFKDSGDYIGKFFETLERQYQPEVVIEDYENTHKFLVNIVACLDPSLVGEIWRVMEDRYPGFDTRRKKMGVLFPNHLAMSKLGGMRYDDELKIWDSR